MMAMRSRQNMDDLHRYIAPVFKEVWDKRALEALSSQSIDDQHEAIKPNSKEESK